jgi:succinate dehydrogenase/fumarate reductase flavoprotein subunit
MIQPKDLPTRCEVLVFGAGMAGHRAALAAAQAGADVLLLEKAAQSGGSSGDGRRNISLHRHRPAKGGGWDRQSSGIANTGDGLVMATALDAGHADLGYVSSSFGGAIRN